MPKQTSFATLAGLLAIALAGSLQAAPLIINSPDHGETLSDSSILNQGLQWNARRQKLTAVITFSNANYDSNIEPLHNDTLAFRLPGVQYDSAENVFYATSHAGVRTPIARFHSTVFGKVIQLLPGAAVYVQRSYGHISIRVVKSQTVQAPHWRLIDVPSDPS